MYAVIRTGGKQYYVTAGDILEVEKLTGDIGETIRLDDVLMITTDDDVTIGQPVVDDAVVSAKITGQYRGKKIQVFRYRPKKRIRVRRGHRQFLTRLEIQSIKWGDLEFVAPKPVIPPPVEPEPEPIVDDMAVDDSPSSESDLAGTETDEMSAVDTQAETATEETSTEETTVAEATAEMAEVEDNISDDVTAEAELADVGAVAAADTDAEETESDNADTASESDKSKE